MNEQKQLPTAIEYYVKNPIHFDVSAEIGEQPASTPEFHFGRQPIGLKDIAKGRKIGVSGAGDVHKKFSAWALDHQGFERHVTTRTNPIQQNGLDYAATLETMPKDIDFLLIQSPPAGHPDAIRWAQEHDLPAMVEKPFVSTHDELVQKGGIDESLKNLRAPVYCMDWEVALATPLFAALGVPAPFKDIVKFENHNAFAQFDKGNITRIETTFLEGGDNPLGDMDYVRKNRPWLFDITKGGGALYDMGVHAMNTLAVLGFMPGEVKSAVLGEAKNGMGKGHYAKIGKENLPPEKQTGEFYARAEMDSHYNGKNIPTLVECGKGGAANDMRITLTDKDGRVLNWEYGPDKSIVTLKDKNGAVLATAHSEIDPYALMFDEAARFFEREKIEKKLNKDYAPAALYYPEHKAVLHALDKMQEIGRAHPVQEGEVVKQLLLEQQVDLGKATVTAPAKTTHKAA